MAHLPSIQDEMYFNLFNDLLKKLSYIGLMELQGALTLEFQIRGQEREMVEAME